MTDHAEIIDPGQMQALLDREQIDMQIATAQKYRRSLEGFRLELGEMALLDEATAASMFYSIPRGKNDDGTQKYIEGATIRFAEAAASSWGNLRCGGRGVDEQEKFVTAQGIAFDLQKNVVWALEVRRNILTSKGHRYSADVIQQTVNSAISIAVRNAILRVIPGGMWKPIYEQARQASVPGGKTIESKREACLAAFAEIGAKREQVFAAMGIKGPLDLDLEMLVRLRGFYTAIRDKETSLEQALAPPGQARAGRKRARKGKLGGKS